MKLLFLIPALFTGIAQAADLKPDTSTEIPASAQRPVVVRLEGKAYSQPIPTTTLPPGYTLELAAAAPLVLHPIMGCLDDRGRLFVGDATGVNWNKAQLEANPPNRVLMLEDADGNGVFDKSTVFADKMTFPQGACWLNGSLYVCSPPGLWKLTDTNNDGVADQREMIVGGFEYTGNAADVHGPFLHPNGRLYWCHGRKGHKVMGKDGALVHEGMACGIWSCLPDGADVRWHSLGSGDNPVEVDFTPNGDIIGVQNLYYTNPRGDTLVHWLQGGVYERGDQLKAIEGLPRTMEQMPVMHNFGHVAVSGSCFWNGHPGGGLQYMVTHFNTQRLVRMELTKNGSTYKAVENEFLKLNNPDVHFTDVMADKDGSLLVLDTGGWFRIGCPASLMAKPDIAGAVYRIRPDKALAQAAKPGPSVLKLPKSEGEILAALASEDPFAKRQACEVISQTVLKSDKVKSALLGLLAQPLDATLEHAVIRAFWDTAEVSADLLSEAKNPVLLRRLLVMTNGANANDLHKAAIRYLDDKDSSLAGTAIWMTSRQSDASGVAAVFEHWLASGKINERQITALVTLSGAFLKDPALHPVVAAMLKSSDAGVSQAALRVLAEQTMGVTSELWKEPLAVLLETNSSPLVLDAIKKQKSPHFDGKLQSIANDAKRPQPLRLRALDSMSSRKLTEETFALLLATLMEPASSSGAKIQAAGMLARSGLSKEQRGVLTPALASVGPIELKELLALLRSTKDVAEVRAMAGELAKNPSLVSQQESVYRTALSSHPPEIFELTVLPSFIKATEAIDARKRELAPLADKAVTKGDASAGKAVFESGRGTCIACHQVAGKGRNIGPDLSHIGAIRTERDLLESILFPSNTLARDYEAHVFETSAGETITGVIRSHTAEGLLVVDVAGQEKTIPHAQLVSDTQLVASLMPMGLDQTLPEKDLLDLVAWLRSLK